MERPGTKDWRQDLEISTVSIGSGDAMTMEAHIPGLTIQAHPDPRRIGEQAPLAALVSGMDVTISRLEPTFGDLRTGELRPLADPHLSRKPLLITSGPQPDTWTFSAKQGNVAVEIQGVPLEGQRTIDSEELDRGVVLLLADRVTLLLHRLDPASPPADTTDLGMVGQSAALNHLKQAIRQVAELSVPVLIEGESGSGKELVAVALHRLSCRRDGPLVSVNMAAVPESLAAAELFGAAKGAFTGATKGRRGFFQRADGGTLFLDEIGETPAQVQPLLLRALEQGEIQPVGADQGCSVDVRIVAATDMDLETAQVEGRFKAPLLHRLRASRLRVPALRQRREDIGRLLIYFLRQELEDCDRANRLVPVGRGEIPWLSARLVARLVQHDWPGNVRQLRNVARYLVVAFRDTAEMATNTHLAELLGWHRAPSRLNTPGEPSAASIPAQPAKRPSIRRPSQITDDELIEALRRHRWRLQPTARDLGISRTSLYALIDKCSRVRRATELSRSEIEDALEHTGHDLDKVIDLLEVSKPGLLRRICQLDIR